MTLEEVFRRTIIELRLEPMEKRLPSLHGIGYKQGKKTIENYKRKLKWIGLRK